MRSRGGARKKQTEALVPVEPKRYRTAQNTDAPTLSEGVNLHVDIPFNRCEYRYHLVEADPGITVFNGECNQLATDEHELKKTNAIKYRVKIPPVVRLSSNDRAHRLKLNKDCLTVTGNEGYALARATHYVSHGKWYYEVEFLSQPGDSQIRIGWAQSHSVVQACVGYSKFSYGWRSLNGTAFHDGYGQSFSKPGFKEGDVLGCLINLPSLTEQIMDNVPPSTFLPLSHKEDPIITFKNHLIYEERPEQVKVKDLKKLPGSYIDFYKNGKLQQLPADKDRDHIFENLYAGHYFPAVSMFHDATVRCNFGPKFKHQIPNGARPMCDRVDDTVLEQTLVDMCDLIHIKMNCDEKIAAAKLAIKEEPISS